MRHMMRRSQEDIENSFNPINLDYIFQDDDPLNPWLEERESPLLDGLQNYEWLLRVDLDDEDIGVGDNDSNSSETPTSGDGGLGPPSDDGDDDGSGGGAN